MANLRSALIRALGLFGLAPARSVGRLAERAEKAESRAEEFKTKLTETRSELQIARARTEELQKQLKAAQSDADRHRIRAQEVTSSVDKWRAKAEKLRVKFSRTSGSVQAASEHLMATETKLDLLEAAINVLDRRTRQAGSPATGTPENGPAS